MRCKNIFGHKWSNWTTSTGGEKKGVEGQIYRPLVQRRHCLKCDYSQSEWLKEVQLLDVDEEKDET